MRFKLARQFFSPELKLLASKEIKQQQIEISRASKKHLKEIAAVSRKIEKEGIPKYLVCKKLKGKLGFGIFLHPDAKPILKGQVIAPYAGVVFICPQNGSDDTDYAFSLIPNIVLSKQEQLRLGGNLPYHPRRLYSLDLDAAKKGNFTRFINHSEKPNVEADLFRIPANPYGLAPSPLEMIYVAKKKILPGEQLLICYEGDEKNYWGVMNIKPFPITPKTFQLNSALQII